MTTAEPSLDLAVIGNGTVGMLVDAKGDYVWGCLPHVAADPSFCALLDPVLEGHGACSIELEGLVSSEQPTHVGGRHEKGHVPTPVQHRPPFEREGNCAGNSLHQLGLHPLRFGGSPADPCGGFEFIRAGP